MRAKLSNLSPPCLRSLQMQPGVACGSNASGNSLIYGCRRRSGGRPRPPPSTPLLPAGPAGLADQVPLDADLRSHRTTGREAASRRGADRHGWRAGNGVSLELPVPSPDPPHAAAINATTARNPSTAGNGLSVVLSLVRTMGATAVGAAATAAWTRLRRGRRGPQRLRVAVTAANSVGLNCAAGQRFSARTAGLRHRASNTGDTPLAAAGAAEQVCGHSRGPDRPGIERTLLLDR